MGLFSFLRRDRSAANERAPRGRRVGDLPSADLVRAQARRRLIGAAVLVVIAVLVLPLVFDSKPRPLPVDIPIDLPKRDLAVALPEPPPPRAETQRAAASDVPAAAAGRVADAPSTSAGKDMAGAERPVPPPSPVASKPLDAQKPAPKPEASKPELHKSPDVRKDSAAKSESKPAPKQEPKPVVKAEAKPEPKIESKVEAKPPRATATDAARAQAALEGKEAATTGSPRYVVQVGAFEQPDGAREARQRVSKAGFQAHESVVQTADGKRIRVRLGPFPNREEADKAAAKLRSAGLSGTVVPQ